MNCPKCGGIIAPDARFCPTCGNHLDTSAKRRKQTNEPLGRPPRYQPGEPHRPGMTGAGPNQYASSGPLSAHEVPDYTRFATGLVIANILCCNLLSLILAIVALVMAKNVRQSLVEGRIEEAASSSRIVKTLCWISFGITSVVFAAYIMVFAAGAFGALMEGMY